jgi:alpha-2-macroglobulin
VRKLAALEALARHGRARRACWARSHLTPAPGPPRRCSTGWILQRVDGVPERAAAWPRRSSCCAPAGGRRHDAALQHRGRDDWWWLMDSADANAARLMLAVLDDPAWRDDLPRLVTGTWRASARRLADHHRQPVGRAGAGALCARFEARRWPGAAGCSWRRRRRLALHDWAAAPDGGSRRCAALAPAGRGAARWRAHEGSGQPWLTVQRWPRCRCGAAAGGYRHHAQRHAVQRSDPALEPRRRACACAGDRGAADMHLGRGQRPGARRRHRAGQRPGARLGHRHAGRAREGNAWRRLRGARRRRLARYYEHLPRGRHVVEYTLRLNNAGRFHLPPTRVEAMYAPETFGEAPNAPRWRCCREPRRLAAP